MLYFNQRLRLKFKHCLSNRYGNNSETSAVSFRLGLAHPDN